MPTTWKYLQNQFDSATEGSRPTMKHLAADHTARLARRAGLPPDHDPDLSHCLARIDPLYDQFENALVAWQVASGEREGETDILEDLLATLSSDRIARWDITIQNVYLRREPKYVQILPDGRGPYQSGTREERILAVKTLGEALKDFPEFAALRTSVITFHSTLKTARSQQQGTEGEISQTSRTCETARLALAVGLYANLGRLMEKYAAEPERVAEFFQINLIRNTSSGSDEESTEPDA